MKARLRGLGRGPHRFTVHAERCDTLVGDSGSSGRLHLHEQWSRAAVAKADRLRRRKGIVPQRRTLALQPRAIATNEWATHCPRQRSSPEVLPYEPVFAVYPK